MQQELKFSLVFQIFLIVCLGFVLLVTLAALRAIYISVVEKLDIIAFSMVLMMT